MIELNVYLEDGRVLKYCVANNDKAREHANAIVTTGWRNITDGMMEYYPVHKVMKVTWKAETKDVLMEKYETKGQ